MLFYIRNRMRYLWRVPITKTLVVQGGRQGLYRGGQVGHQESRTEITLEFGEDGVRGTVRHW